MRTTAERKWSDPVKDKRPSPETLNVKGDLGKLRDVLRRVVRVAEVRKPGTDAVRPA